MGGMKELWEAQQRHAKVFEPKPQPYAAKFKDPGISRENAERINAKGAAKLNEQRLIDLFRSGFEGTADKAGEALGLSPFQVRPICTHLRQQGIIERTPERRTGAGGGTAAVLTLKKGS